MIYKLLTYTEAAKRLGVSRPTFYIILKNKDIDEHEAKAYKKTKISEKCIDEYLESRNRKCSECGDRAIKLDGEYINICSVCVCKQ